MQVTIAAIPSQTSHSGTIRKGSIDAAFFIINELSFSIEIVDNDSRLIFYCFARFLVLWFESYSDKLEWSLMNKVVIYRVREVPVHYWLENFNYLDTAVDFWNKFMQNWCSNQMLKPKRLDKLARTFSFSSYPLSRKLNLEEKIVFGLPNSSPDGLEISSSRACVAMTSRRTHCPWDGGE